MSLFRLETTWSTNDTKVLGPMLKSIAEEPDIELRMELEAALHTWQAQDCIRRAERYRISRLDSERRRRKSTK